MKQLFEMLKQGLIRLAQSEAGEFLSTRRKAHLLHTEIYSRLGASTAAARSAPSAPAANGLSHRCRTRTSAAVR